MDFSLMIFDSTRLSRVARNILFFLGSSENHQRMLRVEQQVKTPNGLNGSHSPGRQFTFHCADCSLTRAQNTTRRRLGSILIERRATCSSPSASLRLRWPKIIPRGPKHRACQPEISLVYYLLFTIWTKLRKLILNYILIRKLTPSFHEERENLQNASCYDPYTLFSPCCSSIDTSTTYLTFLKSLKTAKTLKEYYKKREMPADRFPPSQRYPMIYDAQTKVRYRRGIKNTELAEHIG